MWYVVQTLAGKEESACKAIRQAVAAEERQTEGRNQKPLLETCFVPRCRALKKRDGKLVPVMEALFPGYLIAVTSRVEDLAACIRGHVRSARLIGGQDEAFVPLNRDEVAWIDAFTHCCTQAIEVSTAVVSAGDEVQVVAGPLMGREGWISNVNHRKKVAYLEIPAFGRTIHAQVGHTSGAQTLAGKAAQGAKQVAQWRQIYEGMREKQVQRHITSGGEYCRFLLPRYGCNERMTCRNEQ